MDYNFSRLFRQKKNLDYFIDTGLKVYRSTNNRQNRTLMVVFSKSILENQNLQREIRLWNNQCENKMSIDGFKLIDLDIYDVSSQVALTHSRDKFAKDT